MNLSGTMNIKAGRKNIEVTTNVLVSHRRKLFQYNKYNKMGGGGENINSLNKPDIIRC